MKSITLHIQNMSCAACANRVDTAIRAVPGVGDVAVNLATESASIDIGEPARMSALADSLDHAGYPIETANTSLVVEDMHCASCVHKIESGLNTLPGVISASANLVDETVNVSYAAGVVSEDEIAALVTALGFPASAQTAGESTTMSHPLCLERGQS